MNKRCEKKGHKLYETTIKIMRRSDWPRRIAEEVTVTLDRCLRWGCDYESEYRDEKDVTTFSSVAMPSDYWRKMDEKGYMEV